MSTVDAAPKPVRVQLQGRFWDSQIYSRTLHLFGRDGSMVEVPWDQLVATLRIDPLLRVVADATLLGNHRFYGEGARQLIADPEVKAILLEKFRRLSEATINWDLDYKLIGRLRDNPLPFPHNDSEVFHSSVYVGARSGLFRLGAFEEGRRKARRAVTKILDAPALDIAAKYYTMAVASGEDGLFEVGTRRSDTGYSQVARQSCTSCEWAYSSLVCSGAEQELFFASFVRIPEPSTQRIPKRGYTRKFEGIIEQDTVFGPSLGEKADFQWGAKDKVYRISNGKLDVIRYVPASGEGAAPTFNLLGELRFDEAATLARPIAARVAPFGSVMEFDASLVVLPSLGHPLVLEGEPVSWRLFPRSKDYVNHLHVVYEDHLDIWAFTHDYFADQENKLLGTGVVPGED